MGKVKVAIVGVGNCASSFVQGLAYYGHGQRAPEGVMSAEIGGYGVDDIEVVAAFDVIAGKVDMPLDVAIAAEPNNTLRFAQPFASSVRVSRGKVMDGLGEYLREVVEISDAVTCDVADVLRESGATVVVNYLPVGSEEATRYYAHAAMEAGCAFVNCIPVFIASDPKWATMFREAGVPIIGDDIKSQVGATIVHRVLARLMHERGVKLRRTSQLNVGGNADFMNMLERQRLASKKISKTQAVTSVMGVELPARDVHVGPSDYVPWLEDRKWAHIRLEGEGFGGAPLNIEVKLEVHDSPNSAGVVTDAVRYAQVALDRGISGPLKEPSAWLMKSPPDQMVDEEAARFVDEWLQG
jgi:myo-inositol-1-phosphate synthase